MKDSVKYHYNKTENHASVYKSESKYSWIFWFFFFLVHTYSSEIISAEEQRGLDMAVGGIFLKA